MKNVEKVVRIFDSFEEADAADALAGAQMSPQQRVDIFCELRERANPDAFKQGLARVYRVLELEQSRVPGGGRARRFVARISALLGRFRFPRSPDPGQCRACPGRPRRLRYGESRYFGCRSVRSWQSNPIGV